MSQFDNLTPEEAAIVVDAVRSKASMYTVVYGSIDPVLEALVVKISPVETPAAVEVEQVPVEPVVEVEQVPAEPAAEANAAE
jgi:hypothetical protein